MHSFGMWFDFGTEKLGESTEKKSNSRMISERKKMNGRKEKVNIFNAITLCL